MEKDVSLRLFFPTYHLLGILCLDMAEGFVYNLIHEVMHGLAGVIKFGVARKEPEWPQTVSLS